MRIATCQMGEVLGDIRSAAAKITRVASRATTLRADLVVFPEAALCGYRLDASFVDRQAQHAQHIIDVMEGTHHLDAVLVFGAYLREGPTLSNAAIVMHRGHILHIYRKRMLIGAECKRFTPGSVTEPFSLGSNRLSITICADTRSKAIALEARQHGATHVLCLANNMLPIPAAHAWRTRHHPARSEFARHAGCPVVSSDVTGSRDHHLAMGPTSILRGDGSLVAQLPLEQPGLLVMNLPSPLPR